MAVDLQLSSVTDSVDFPYKALSRGAIASVLLAFPAAIGLIETFYPLLALALIGIATAAWAMISIRRYPDEYSGEAIAIGGLTVNAAILIGGIALHTYSYLTEVPDGYARVSFYELQQPEPLPDLPTHRAVEIDGQPVFLKGYIHPSSGSGMLRRFILVPDLGTCCFGGQPRSTDMIEVTLTGGKTVKAGLTKLKLAGKFQLNPYAQKMADFDNQIYYQMRVDQFR